SSIAAVDDVTINVHGNEAGQIIINESSISAGDDVVATVDSYTQEAILDDADQLSVITSYVSITDSEIFSGDDILLGAKANRYGHAAVVVNGAELDAEDDVWMGAMANRGHAGVFVTDSTVEA